MVEMDDLLFLSGCIICITALTMKMFDDYNNSLSIYPYLMMMMGFVCFYIWKVVSQ